MRKNTVLFIILFGHFASSAQAGTFTNAKVTPQYDEARGLIAVVANASMSPLRLQRLDVTLDEGGPACKFHSDQVVELGAGERAEVHVATSAEVAECWRSSALTAPTNLQGAFRISSMTAGLTDNERGASRVPNQTMTVNATWHYRDTQRTSQHRWLLSHE